MIILRLVPKTGGLVESGNDADKPKANYRQNPLRELARLLFIQ